MGDIALYFEEDVLPCKKKDLAGADRYYKEVCFDYGKDKRQGQSLIPYTAAEG